MRSEAVTGSNVVDALHRRQTIANRSIRIVWQQWSLCIDSATYDLTLKLALGLFASGYTISLFSHSMYKSSLIQP